MNEFDELWNERVELLNIEERDDPFCTCEEYGEDSCQIHSKVGLEVIENKDVERLTKTKVSKTKIHNKGKKTTQR